MQQPPRIAEIDLNILGRALRTLGTVGRVSGYAALTKTLLVSTNVAAAVSTGEQGDSETELAATNYLFVLGPTRSVMSAIRRVMSLVDVYREHLLDSLCIGLKKLPDDKALADTLERLDHLSAELLARLEISSPSQPSPLKGERVSVGYSTKEKRSQRVSSPKMKKSAESQFARWDAEMWQAPDAITLLAKVVDTPDDFPEQPAGPKVAVGFDWLAWDTPPATPAPAPWGDREPLRSPLSTTRHPFWGALVVTLDACTGDYEWQSLMLRGGVLRSHHRALGKAEELLHELWSRALGLYPVPPFVLSEDIAFTPGKPLPWLQPALEHLAEAEVATQAEGSWRLTDAFRTQLMKDDEHMLTFEAVRKRSYRLAHAAEQMTEHPFTLDPRPLGGEGI